MTKEQIKAYARDIEDSIRLNVVGKLETVDKEFFSGLQHHVRQLENRSKEYHNPSFVVLVVGPVKSGKSTFVNLVAKNYVSPTHFLECTVRPSIISKKEGDGYLEVYESCNPGNKSDQMDDILDFLNGLIDKHEIKDVNVHQREFSKDNIDKYVKCSLAEVLNDDILLTAIHTEGGKLLQDNVLLVDMAGFDGANVNFESPAYKAIVERADLIIFVQSSNSAISKVSSDFFKLLSETNRSVPVCLVHNVFEAAYWRSDELKREDIEFQKQHAVDVIRDTHKLTLEESNAFNLNLGKVNDLRENNYEEENEAVLNAEAVAFENAEEEMYRLFEKRESIRLKNCISRTKIHKERLLNSIIALQNEQDELRRKYEEIREKFENLKRSENGMPLTVAVTISLDELKNLVDQVYFEIKRLDIREVDDDDKEIYTTEEARAIVQKFLSNVDSKLNTYLHLKQREVCSIKTCDELQQWLTEINQAALSFGIMGITNVDCDVEEKTIIYNLGISVESKVPEKKWWYRHSVNEVNKYLKDFRDKLLGFQAGHGAVVVHGCVEDEIYTGIQNIVNESIVSAKSSIISFVNEKNENIKLQALEKIIPDFEKFLHNYKDLLELRRNVENLNIIDIA